MVAVMTRSSDVVEQVLGSASREGRSVLFEHEVYSIIEAIGVGDVPQTVFVPVGQSLPVGALDRFPGDRVVVKVVSDQIAHKSDIGGVVFVDRNEADVNQALESMFADKRIEKAGKVRGALLCRFVDYGAEVFGRELFVGLRWTREFGPVLAAGLGGVNTEYYAANLTKGRAVAMAAALDTSGPEFLSLFRQTVAYELITGEARGHKRRLDDEQLLRCFGAFIDLAREFSSPDRGDKPAIGELEVNPFAVCEGNLVPLDGLCRMGSCEVPSVPRPVTKVDKLLHPKSIAVIGASAKGMNPGRVILRNVVEAGFPVDSVHAVKEGLTELDGVPCVSTVADLPGPVDLMVLAVAANQIPALAEEIINRRSAGAVILIPGGLGETEGGKETEKKLRERIAGAHGDEDGGPVFLGGNCLGVFSRPGRYDTLFIPKSKLPKHWDRGGRRVALISQSGAFMITRMSNLESIDPGYAVSCGNQVDLTVADIVDFLAGGDAVDVFGVYVEGFNDLGGLALAQHVRRVVASGKEVVFYKAGRTAAGRTATAGHTASIAGDYASCEAALGNAGAIVAGTFKEFEYFLELACLLHGRKVNGTRIACSSNAGYESVGMADAINGPDYAVELVPFDGKTTERVTEILKDNRLDRLVNPHAPLDLTPMASDEVHEACIRAMLQRDDIDGVVAAFVPLTPAMKTTPEEIEHESSMINRLPKVFADTDKPMVVAIDSGSLYDPLAHRIKEAGIPVFRSADSAVRTLGRYLCHKMRH